MALRSRRLFDQPGSLTLQGLKKLDILADLRNHVFSRRLMLLPELGELLQQGSILPPQVPQRVFGLFEGKKCGGPVVGALPSGVLLNVLAQLQALMGLKPNSAEDLKDFFL